MPDVSLEPVAGDPFAFPGTTTADTMAAAADPAARARLADKLSQTSWGHIYNTLTSGIDKLRSGEWDVSSPEAAERTGAIGGALDVAGLGSAPTHFAMPGEQVIGAGIIPRRASSYTQELIGPERPPPPMGHNMPPPGPLPEEPPVEAAPTTPVPGAAETPPPLTTAPPPTEAPAPRVKKPPPFIKQEDPFTSPIGEHPLEEALTVNDILHPAYPALKPRSRGVEDIAQDLHDRAQQTLKDMGIKSGRITGPDPVTDELLARNIVSETKRALDAPGANAGDWYTGKVKEAMDTAALMYPEIATDPGAKAAFQAALAITSQGESVASNVRLATQAYDYFRENGRFRTDITAKKGPSMGRSFQKFNDLVDAGGLDATREFLDAPTTPRQLTQDGHKVSTSESLDTPVYGSHLFGAKIGNGFYQNLGGNFNPVTFDLWWMRQWNRKTGNLVGLPDITAQRLRFEEAHANPLESMDPAQQALYAGKPAPRTLPGLDKRADEIIAQHERDFKQFRPEFDAKIRRKSELANAAFAYRDARFGINEAPKSGSQREWMRRVTYRARDLLEQEGYKLTPADLQAILWYPEKDLYAKLGGRPSEEINIDYAQALMQEARRRGHIGDQPAPLLPSSGRPGPASAGGNPGGEPGGLAAQHGQVPAGEAGPGGLSIEPAPGDPFAGIP